MIVLLAGRVGLYSEAGGTGARSWISAPAGSAACFRTPDFRRRRQLIVEEDDDVRGCTSVTSRC
jgi:hypothetical protein